MANTGPNQQTQQKGLMQVAVDMGTRQRHQIFLAPPSLVVSAHSKNRKLHGEHADHFEAASWNGPAHADWMCTLEETPDRTREREALVSTLSPDPFSDRARIDRRRSEEIQGRYKASREKQLTVIQQPTVSRMVFGQLRALSFVFFFCCLFFRLPRSTVMLCPTSKATDDHDRYPKKRENRIGPKHKRPK